LKYSDDGKNVWVSVDNKKTKLGVIIKDEGFGIPDEDQSHLFATFFRGKNVINIEGTGLGLPIVKKYLDLLHGDIQLQSKLEVGTTVNLNFPSLQENKN
jgi:signal transduction histidine kinase